MIQVIWARRISADLAKIRPLPQAPTCVLVNQYGQFEAFGQVPLYTYGQEVARLPERDYRWC